MFLTETAPQLRNPLEDDTSGFEIYYNASLTSLIAYKPDSPDAMRQSITVSPEATRAAAGIRRDVLTLNLSATDSGRSP